MRHTFPALKLPTPVTTEWDWQLRAQCRSMPVAMFFPPQGLRGARLRGAELYAKQVCGQCPVRAQCLQHALAAGEPFGIWGGTTALERSEWLSGRLGKIASRS